MKIAMLCYHRVGGSGIVAYEIGRAMAEERGHEVHFMGLQPPYRLKEASSEALHFHRVWVKEYPVFDYQPYDLALASQLSEIIIRYGIEVIHSHYVLPHAISAILARSIVNRSLRLVTTLHGTDITVVGQHPSMMHITRYGIEASDRVTAVSQSLKTETELFFKPRKEIECIYNFINPEVFLPLPEKAQGKPRDLEPVFLHVSNLREVKGPVDVIRIFARARALLGGHGLLKVIGEGPMESVMAGEAERLGVEKQVSFLGERSDLVWLFNCADICLMPSRKEAFGLAALESMACGTPVLAAAVGGLPEVIEDGVNSLLFSLADLDEAAEKAVALLKDRQRYREISLRGVETARERFPMNSILDQYEAVYCR